MNTTDSSGTILRDYVRILRRGALIVIATTVIVTGIAIASSLSQEKLYEASADVFLAGARNLPSNIADLQAYSVDPERAGNTQASLARVPAVARRTLKEAKVSDRTADDLLGSSSVATTPEADILTFTVTDTDPDVANRLATAYANAFTSYRREIDTGSIVKAREQIERRLKGLEADGNTRSPLYQDLATNDQQLRTAEALQGSNAELVRSGTGAVQIQPKPMRNAMLGLVLGLVVGVGLAFLRDALNTRVRSAEEVQEKLGLALLSRVPEPPKELRRGEGIVMLARPEAPEAEAYRIAATNLGFVNLDRGARTIMFTSALRGEGKSTTAANVAVALARSGARVILVDLDLKRPSQDRLFQLAQGPGFTNVALGHTDLSNALVPIPLWENKAAGGELNADQPGALGVLPTGPTPPNTADFVASSKVQKVLDRLVTYADIVLVDAPSILQVSDAVTLTAKVDAVVAVTRLSMIRRPALRELHRVLEGAPVAKLGFVLTGARPEEGYGYGQRAAANNGSSATGVAEISHGR